MPFASTRTLNLMASAVEHYYLTWGCGPLAFRCSARDVPPRSTMRFPAALRSEPCDFTQGVGPLAIDALVPVGLFFRRMHFLAHAVRAVLPNRTFFGNEHLREMGGPLVFNTSVCFAKKGVTRHQCVGRRSATQSVAMYNMGRHPDNAICTCPHNNNNDNKHTLTSASTSKWPLKPCSVECCFRVPYGVCLVPRHVRGSGTELCLVVCNRTQGLGALTFSKLVPDDTDLNKCKFTKGCACCS